MDWAVILAFLAGLSGSIVTILGNYITKRHESKTAIKLSILENAFKEYEIKTKMMEHFADKGEQVTFYPWDMYALSYAKLIKLMDKKDINEEDITRLLRDFKHIKNAYDFEEVSETKNEF